MEQEEAFDRDQTGGGGEENGVKDGNMFDEEYGNLEEKRRVCFQ